MLTNGRPLSEGFCEGQWPRHPDEEARLHVLTSFDVLDTAAEEAFDHIALFATQHFRTPIALVSLVDESRQWFKACYGLGDTRATSRDSAFCAYAILPAAPDVTEACGNLFHFSL
jgi:GAF domain-containing protein